jgi:hypothetical protein
MNASVLDPTIDPDTAALDAGQPALISWSGDIDAGSLASLRDALGSIVASGHRLVLDMTRVEFFGSAGTVARRIPTVGTVLDALRRPEIGDRRAGPVLPVVSADKLHC